MMWRVMMGLNYFKKDYQGPVSDALDIAGVAGAVVNPAIPAPALLHKYLLC